jgi:hypothetical protein
VLKITKRLLLDWGVVLVPSRSTGRAHSAIASTSDISVRHDQAEAHVAAAIAARGHLVTDQHAPAWWVLADAEGNEGRGATWMGRD